MKGLEASMNHRELTKEAYSSNVYENTRLGAKSFMDSPEVVGKLFAQRGQEIADRGKELGAGAGQAVKGGAKMVSSPFRAGANFLGNLFGSGGGKGSSGKSGGHKYPKGSKGGGSKGGGSKGGYYGSDKHIGHLEGDRKKLLGTTATLGGGLAGGFLGRHVGRSLDNAYNRATGKGSKRGERGTNIGQTVGSLAGTGLGAMAGNALKENIFHKGGFEFPWTLQKSSSVNHLDEALKKVANQHDVDPKELHNMLKKNLV